MEQESLIASQPLKNRLVPITISSIILAALVAGGGVYAYQKSQNDKQQENLQSQIDSLNSQVGLLNSAASPTPTSMATPISTASPQLTATPTATLESTAGWKTYTNSEYGYSVKYPSDWTVSESDAGLGAAFIPTVDTPINNLAIVVSFLTKPTDYQATAFTDYEKIAAIEEIQNYYKLESTKAITTASGVIGYQNTWDVKDTTGKTSVSQPFTYFQPKDTTGTVQLTLENMKYLDTYNAMVSTYQQ